MADFVFAFLDCEFGGLDPVLHDITEIGVIQFEDWVDTGEEYEALDEVAKDLRISPGDLDAHLARLADARWPGTLRIMQSNGGVASAERVRDEKMASPFRDELNPISGVEVIDTEETLSRKVVCACDVAP